MFDPFNPDPDELWPFRLWGCSDADGCVGDMLGFVVFMLLLALLVYGR